MSIAMFDSFAIMASLEFNEHIFKYMCLNSLFLDSNLALHFLQIGCSDVVNEAGITIPTYVSSLGS